MDNDERERENDESSEGTEKGPEKEGDNAAPAIEDEVDEASDQSFPASDPPAY